MGINCYLAMTEREFACCDVLPAYPAWLDCHFSLYGTGLSGLPNSLPKDAMVVLTDRVSLRGHLPEQVSSELASVSPKYVLLDFQAQPTEEAYAMVRTLCKSLLCPVAVTEGYADCSEGPVLITPPLNVPLEDHIASWPGRELWLEVATEEASVCVTADGATLLTAPHKAAPTFFDPALCCGYQTTLSPGAVNFQLRRDTSHLNALLHKAEDLGFRQAVGLYQQLCGVDL